MLQNCYHFVIKRNAVLSPRHASLLSRRPEVLVKGSKMSRMKEYLYTLESAAEENTKLGAAASYLLKDWKVMPLLPNKKDPHFDLIKRAYLDASDDWDLINFWFKVDPKANLGIACKQSNIVVIDIDYRNGGQKQDWMNDTYTVKTGDGLHLYYQADQDMEFRSNAGDGIDVKWKGYVMAPPSVHPNGSIYEVINQMPVSAMSDELMDEVLK